MRLRFSMGVVVLAGFLLLHGIAARAADHVLLVGGLGGNEGYSREFADSLKTLQQVLTQRHGYDLQKTRLFLESSSGTAADSATTATLEAFEQTIDSMRQTLSTSDTLLLVMIGHGQSDYVEAKFNLRGPDLTDRRLGELLDALPTRNQRLILDFPCSGQFSETLARRGRVILASTDGPRQIYHTILTRYLLAALQGDDADTNRDGSLDFRELYEYISHEVAGYYEAKGQLTSENPSLEDNGDGDVTTQEEGMDAGDGEFALQVPIAPAPGS